MKKQLKMYSLILIGGVAFIFSFLMCYIGIEIVREGFSEYMIGIPVFIGGLASIICSINVWYCASENHNVEERVENIEKK
jgi:hypothetical protein